MEEKRRKRVVVVGGGVIGSCCAYFLSEDGKDEVEVIVLERSTVACASSGRAGGFLASDWCGHSDPIDVLAKESFKLHIQLADKLNGKENWEFRMVDTYAVDIDLHAPVTNPKGSIHPLSPVPEGKRLWFDGSGLDGAQSQFSHIGTEENTAQVHPKLFTEKILEGAKSNGNVTVRERTNVTGLKIENDAIIGVILDTGEVVEADDVILAVGPWTKTIVSRWLESVDTSLSTSLCNYIIPEKYYSIIVETNKPEEKEKISAACLFTKNKGSSPITKLTEPEVYPRSSGLVYICGCEETIPLPDDPDQIEASVGEYIDFLASIGSKVSTLLETSGDSPTASIITKQACYLPNSRDAIPLLGPIPTVKHLWMASGHGCWGILYSPITGKLMSHLVLNTPSAINMDPYRIERILE